MLAKRIIPCLDLQNGRTVKGVRFEGLRDAGEPVQLASHYARMGADELVLLDIAASHEGRNTQFSWVSEVAAVLDIPFTVGGGIASLATIEKLLESGVDKVSLNSAAFRNPGLISEAARRFGSQCVVVAIDVARTSHHFEVYVQGGRQATAVGALTWAQQAAEAGAGEILLTSIDADGTKNGFDLALTRLLSENLPIPVIASGGAGQKSHFTEVFTQGAADAALAASVFHFGEIAIPELKNYLQQQNICVRL